MVFAISSNTNAQVFMKIDFENTCEDNKYILNDTNVPGNIWRIGKSVKKIYSLHHGGENVMITDLRNSYPSNYKSSFILKVKPFTEAFKRLELLFEFKMESDTIKDFGNIEISTDNGKTWTDLFENNPSFQRLIDYFYPIDSYLSGELYSEWHFIYFNIDSNFVTYKDTVLFRFNFFSDSIQNNKDGWMIDDIVVEPVLISSVPEKSINGVLQVIPSLIKKEQSFEIVSQNDIFTTISIYDIKGNIIKHNSLFSGKQTFNASDFSPGLYIVKHILNSNKTNYTKFIILP